MNLEELVDKLFDRLEEMNVDDQSGKHRFNMIVRNIEERLHRLESEKLNDFDPEKNK